MFTGIIEGLGKIEKITDTQLVLDTDIGEINIGDSVSINGVCLTASKIMGKKVYFDISPETGEKSTVFMLKAGDMVNLERAMKFGSRLGGHLVSGHVEGTGKILKIRKRNDSYEFTLSVPPELIKYIIIKGSIAIDGISLTVSNIENDTVSISVIPHTFKNTVLSLKKQGDLLNIETDLFAKYIENMLKNQQKRTIITEGFLKENGF